jgi:hypothetical protein
MTCISVYLYISVARWPKFRPKRSKGAVEKLSWPEEFMAEFWPNFGRILPKVAEKGAEEYFLKKYLIERCSHTFRGKEKLKLHFELTLRVYCIDVFLKLADIFQYWPNFFDVLTGKQFRDLASLLYMLNFSSVLCLVLRERVHYRYSSGKGACRWQFWHIKALAKLAPVLSAITSHLSLLFSIILVPLKSYNRGYCASTDIFHKAVKIKTTSSVL